ncbi:hypothetical protein PGB90_005339 [Kerria lacca]
MQMIQVKNGFTIYPTVFIHIGTIKLIYENIDKKARERAKMNNNNNNNKERTEEEKVYKQQ